ncbi:MAG TPA: sigma-70 family RNA polymerase sigma factor [Anaerolineales bacterium]|nr:sigma-70 family RNA polymerase sigma factor [Anaerolineales bacterium]
MNLDDKELISRVVHQDQRAFVALYERYSSRIYTLILHMVNDRMLAEEVLQETFLRLWKRADQYVPERGSPLIWLLAIARRTTLERLRFESHRPILSDGNEPSSLLESIPQPETTSEEARWRSLYLAVQALPAEQKQLIELAYYQGMSQSEIAEILGLPLGTVKTRLRAGMMRLRRQWLEEENPSSKSKT